MKLTSVLDSHLVLIVWRFSTTVCTCSDTQTLLRPLQRPHEVPLVSLLLVPGIASVLHSRPLQHPPSTLEVNQIGARLSDLMALDSRYQHHLLHYGTVP